MKSNSVMLEHIFKIRRKPDEFLRGELHQKPSNSACLIVIVIIILISIFSPKPKTTPPESQTNKPPNESTEVPIEPTPQDLNNKGDAKFLSGDYSHFR
ncbi:MAG: hypothetical protein SFT94_08385 [Pseudanabaenaceae cyanobacterium bins.68]|nr:hypothetical protein [Pseudanabaenaceae cyanobacterium bins.68]